MSWNYVGVQGVFTQPETPQTCCNLSFADLLQLVETTCDKPVDDKFDKSDKTTCSKSVNSLNKPANNLRQVWWEQLAASLLTTCIWPVSTSWCKPCERIWYQLDSTSCSRPAADLLQFERFWLCSGRLYQKIRGSYKFSLRYYAKFVPQKRFYRIF